MISFTDLSHTAAVLLDFGNVANLIVHQQSLDQSSWFKALAQVLGRINIYRHIDIQYSGVGPMQYTQLALILTVLVKSFLDKLIRQLKNKQSCVPTDLGAISKQATIFFYQRLMLGLIKITSNIKQ